MEIQEETLRIIADNLEKPHFEKLPSGRKVAYPLKYANVPIGFWNYKSRQGDFVSGLGNKEFSRLVNIMGERLRMPIVLSSVDTTYEAFCIDKELGKFGDGYTYFLNREVVLKSGFIVKSPTLIVEEGKFKYNTRSGTKADINVENAVETLVKAGVLQTTGKIPQYGCKIHFNDSGVSSISSMCKDEFYIGGDPPDFSSYKGLGLPELLKK